MLFTAKLSILAFLARYRFSICSSLKTLLEMASGPSSHSDNRATTADSPVSSAIHDSTSREEGYSIEYLAFTALKAIEALSAEFGDQTDDACDLSSRLEGDNATKSRDVTAAQAIEALPADLSGQKDDAYDLSGGLESDDATTSLPFTGFQAIGAQSAEFDAQTDDVCDLSSGLEGDDATASPFTAVQTIEAPLAESGCQTYDAFDLFTGLEGDDATTGLAFAAAQAREALLAEFGGQTDDAFDIPSGLEGEVATLQAIEAPLAESGLQTYDEFDLISGLEGGETTASLAPIILPGHTYERGRRYPVFGDIQYPIPIDEMEQDREDMQHAMMMMLMRDKLFLSPIGNHPQSIFDIGTGTGTWAIQVGERYPSATVRGIDIALIQPGMVPSNVSFLVNDCEQEWAERYVDLVHFRFMITMLRDTSKVLGHAFKSLRPGGWIELQEYESTPMCDDGTMPNDDAVKHLYELVERSFEKFGLKANLAPQLGTYLEKAGFEDIRCQVMKVPIGPWTKDKTMRIIGQYQKSVIVDGLPFLAGRPFQALEMSDAEIEATIAKARKRLHDPKVHRYLNYYFWYAQKPQWCRA
ncbi:hypothetical protein E4U25_002283 [Claviceps purpurea]|nr:hypothetical protein E4U25_002283 [Claviceps purpurea]